MVKDKGKEKISVWFSRFIRPVAIILWIVFFCCGVGLYIWERYGAKMPCFISFLREWKTTFFASSVCIWGFTLTCMIFLLGKLEDVYYGTSLKRIFIMCFGKMVISVYVCSYMVLIPLMVLFYYWGSWLVSGWLQVINYAYGIGLILFVLVISLRNTVIELIRDRTIKQLRAKNFNEGLYNDEQFAVLNMIRKLDYNDAWQCARLQSVVIDMALVALEKNRVYVMYNVICTIVQYAGYDTEEKRNRVVNILNSVNSAIANEKPKEKFEDKKRKEAITIIILPILQVNVKATEGKWISELINVLPWVMRRDVSAVLIFGAEYLNECGIYYESTVDELIDKHIELMRNNMGAREREELYDEIYECWLNLNLYNDQGVNNIVLYKNFFTDYINIDKNICTTKMLLKLQTRKLEKMEK